MHFKLLRVLNFDRMWFPLHPHVIKVSILYISVNLELNGSITHSYAKSHEHGATKTVEPWEGYRARLCSTHSSWGSH